jgi:hypothetical protein
MWGMNVMVQLKVVVRFILGVSALVALTAPVAAELIVSGAAGIDSMRIGAKFSDDTVFKLPANSELRLLRSPDNTPFVMRGPYEGTLSNYIANCSGYLAPFRSYCHDSGDRPPTGATRGLRPSN